MSNEIELYTKLNGPKDVMDFGIALSKSGFFGVDRPEAGVVILMTCMIERITPLDYIRTYDTVSGKPRKKAMAAYAEFRKKGGKVKWLKTGDDGIEASAEFTFDGQSVTLSFTMEMAKKAQLIKKDGGYDKNPGNMLRARLISNALGMLAPEIFAGTADDSDLVEGPSLSIPATEQPAKTRAKVDVKSEPTPPPAPTAPAGTIDVVSEVVTEATAATAATSAQPSTPVAGSTVSSAGGLSDELREKVEKVIGEHAIAAVNWMLNQGYLKPGESITNLTEERAKKIIANPDGFIRRVKELAAKGGAK